MQHYVDILLWNKPELWWISFERLHRVALVRTEVSEEHSAFICSVSRLLNLSSSQRRYASRRTAKRASCNGTSTVVSIRYRGVVDWSLLRQMYLELRPHRGIYRLHLQDNATLSRRPWICRCKRLPSPSVVRPIFAASWEHSRVLLPWRWKRYVHPKRRFLLELQGIISQRHSSLLPPWQHPRRQRSSALQ
jgi:hypothetical protein